MAPYSKGGIYVDSAVAAANTVTLTMTAPPAGSVNKILWIAVYTTAATAADIQIQRNDGTLLCRIGGVGTAIAGTPLVFGSGPQKETGIPNDTAADATKIVLTTTAGTNTQITVGYVNVPA